MKVFFGTYAVGGLFSGSQPHAVGNIPPEPFQLFSCCVTAEQPAANARIIHCCQSASQPLNQLIQRLA